MDSLLAKSGMGRRWLGRRLSPGPLRDFYDIPAPEGTTPLAAVDFVALDLETTGLEPKQHAIVSIGWVVVQNLTIDLSMSGHKLVKPDRGLTADSAAIHGILDDQLETAASLSFVLTELLPILAGRVMIAHYARLEMGFLDAACRQVFGGPFTLPVVDTLAVEHRRMQRRNQPVVKGSLRLDAVRQRYNLPRYRAHNALIDAIAAAELFLAQMAERDGGGRLRLKDIL